MNKVKWIIACAFTLLLLSSCMTSTKVFVEGELSDPNTSVTEKFALINAEPLSLTYPEAYFDAKAFLNRLIEIVSDAEDYIYITTFLGSYSEGLDELYRAIAEKAKAGVEVYFVYDGISSFDQTESRFHMAPLAFLKKSGVHLHEYNPLSLPRLIAPQTFLYRDHRKLFVVDGKYAVIGGMNLNYISLAANDVNLQRDSMYIFKSAELAKALTEEFVVLWNEASVEKIKMPNLTYEDEEEPTLIGYLFNQGEAEHGDIADAYSALVNSAREEIVALPYLPLMDDRMYEAFENAIARGVSVKFFVPTDTRGYVQAATYYDYWRLVDAGIEVYFERAEADEESSLLHQKLMVVDGRWTLIGSTNVNLRSMALSYEITLAIDDEEFAAFSLEQVKDVFKDAEPLTLEEALEMKEEKGMYPMYLFSYYGG